MLGIWQQRLLPLSQYTVPLLWNSLLRKNNLYKLKCRQAVDNSLFQYDSYTPIRLLLNCFKYIPNNGMWDDQNWIPTCFMVSSNFSRTKVFALANALLGLLAPASRDPQANQANQSIGLLQLDWAVHFISLPEVVVKCCPRSATGGSWRSPR